MADFHFRVSDSFGGVFGDIAKSKGMSSAQLLQHIVSSFVFSEGFKSYEVPEDLRQQLLSEEADKKLRFALKKRLWLHNAYCKMSSLFRQNVPVKVVESILEIYVQYAESVEWSEYANELDRMLHYLRSGKYGDVRNFLREYLGGGLNEVAEAYEEAKAQNESRK